METKEIIPFGKYKGQPIEVIQADKQYSDWLMAQDWFREKYPQYMTLIINNFNTPSDSPEHNTLTSYFLDDEFCIKLISVVSKTNIDWDKQCKESKYTNFKWLSEPVIELRKYFELKDGNDVGIDMIVSRKYEYEEIDYSKRTYSIKEIMNTNLDEKPIEVDMPMIKKIGHETPMYYERIECKPIIGDDYPSVIRQCRAQKSTMLFIGKFSSSVISIEQLRLMFSDLKIVLLSDVI